MTTIPENDPPRGGTPLDDAMAGRDAGDEPLVGGEGGADAGADGGADVARARTTPPPTPKRTSASPEPPDLRSSRRIGMIVPGGQRSDGPRTAAGATTGSEMTWHSTTTT